MKKKLIHNLVIIFIFFCVSLIAQTDIINVGNTDGYIYKKDGKTPKNGVIVELQRIIRSDKNKKIEFKEKYLSNETGNDGMYWLKDLPVGEYMVKIKKGKKTIKLRKVDFFIMIYKGRTIQFSFTLLK